MSSSRPLCHFRPLVTENLPCETWKCEKMYGYLKFRGKRIPQHYWKSYDKTIKLQILNFLFRCFVIIFSAMLGYSFSLILSNHTFFYTSRSHKEDFHTKWTTTGHFTLHDYIVLWHEKIFSFFLRKSLVDFGHDLYWMFSLFQFLPK